MQTYPLVKSSFRQLLKWELRMSSAHSITYELSIHKDYGC